MNQSIVVSGAGSATGPPDVVVLSVGVEVLARSVAEARAKAAGDAEQVLAALRHHGLESADLRTASLAIHPEYDHRDGRRLRGYRVANSVEATIRDTAGVGNVIDAVVAAGGDSTVVNGIHFTHEDPTDLETRARNAAWVDAQRKATQLADLAGVTLGAARSITEGQSFGAPLPPMRAMAREAAMATPVEAGELAVAITINVEFSITD
jgi:uncharacterized protein YggE